MPIKAKICGITSLEDARFAAGAGADFLGFIQYAGSPRYITPQAAKAIIDWVYGSESVGVFVNENIDTINQVAETAGFDLVQLHGDESPEVCAAVAPPVIKAFRVAPEDTAETLHARMEPYRPHVAYFLLDTHHADLWGGTGKSFDWQQTRTLTADFPILLAGGINADNVMQAVRTVQPLGVDLSSSVEEAPGRKDFDKLTAFFDVFNALREDAVTDPK
jgi:phosphoribosylanthranilate isomerase